MKRYYLENVHQEYLSCCKMTENAEGDWVEYDEAQARIDELESENKRLQAYEFASQQGHPQPCTLGPLCPYCEIERLRTELAALKEWRPIESVKKYNPVLIAFKAGKERVPIVGEGKVTEKGVFVFGFQTYLPENYILLGWLPLPEAPKGEV